MSSPSGREQQAEAERRDADRGHADGQWQDVGGPCRRLDVAGSESPARVPTGQEVARHPETEDHRADRDVGALEPVQGEPPHHDEPTGDDGEAAAVPGQVGALVGGGARAAHEPAPSAITRTNPNRATTDTTTATINGSLELGSGSAWAIASPLRRHSQ